MENTQKKHIKAALYIRVSTEDQAREGYSLAVQKDYLLDFAKKQQWEVHFLDRKHRVYEDDGYSGYSLERPAFSQLLEDARAKKFDLILVYKLDRFSRRLRDILNVLDEFDSLGVQFKSATEPYETTTSSGKLMLQQLGSFAEFERNRIIERVVPGMVRGVQAGHWQGARYSPFGYSYDKLSKRLQVVKEEAEIVKEIFQRYIAGESCQKIGGVFYEKKILSRSGGRFNSSLVLKILRNKIYIGKIVWNVHRYDRKQKTLKGFRYIKNDPSKIIEADGLHEPIIKEEIFYQAQRYLDRNRKGKFNRTKNREYPLSGTVTCAKCGAHYNGATNVKNHRTGEKTPYYRCSSRASYNIKCGNGDVRAEVLEGQVFDILDVLFSAESVSIERMHNLIADQYRNEATNEVSKEIEALKKNLLGCTTKLSKLTDLHLADIISREILEEKSQKLRNEEGELRIKIERTELQLIEKEASQDYIKRAEAVAQSTKSFKENLHPALRKELLKLVFKKLIVETQTISRFELYEPFNSMYQSALAAQNTGENTERRYTKWKALNMTQSQSSIQKPCLLPPSDVK